MDSKALEIKKAINDDAFNEYSKLLDDAGNEATKNGLTNDKLETLLQEVRDDAAQNGLTEEILTKLLNDENH